MGFAINRRQRTDKPVDHDVPILKIASPEGKLRAVLFGYACHNTTLMGECYLINGDYAGFAQIELEKALPATTAMFLQLCGGDQNPAPRGTLELAAQHGKTLADEVQRVLAGTPDPFAPRSAPFMKTSDWISSAETALCSSRRRRTAIRSAGVAPKPCLPPSTPVV